ncbi:MAG: hypothetical protein JWQ48_468 [Conexibacter sp.]|nr:hypothetical protein [Conexibacter sp.]
MEATHRFRTPRDLVVVLVLAVVGILIALPQALSAERWSPDTLFYEAQVHELQGTPRTAARDEVFSSNLAATLKRNEQALAPRLRRVDNPAWVTYSSRFYRRRWSVPAAATAIEPLAGTRSLKIISLLGYVVVGPLLFLLLRRRFGFAASAGAAVLCMVLPPLLTQAGGGGTDTWGLALLVAGLLFAVLTRERGPRWLPAWIATLLLLSVTRDATVVLVVAVAWLALVDRSRRAVALLVTGVLASLPAPLIFSAPLRDNLAYVFRDFRIPTDTSWSSILHAYPSRFVDMLHSDARYPVDTAVPPFTVLVGLVALVGVCALFALRERRDPFIAMLRGSVLGAVLTILISVNATDFRLELVFVPGVAAGLALLAERLIVRRSRAPARRVAPIAAESP